ncbi:hypothetical protein Y1Q_0002864 [Alligator mississippiensis]|uniref:Uncharacterized protein n=1 Tax=Alligator mississippiensis TaxID=8496 RepID=A0A151NZD4_ALLMI|nr:hypothetical protein Y1Q_0002864 [Alligator mississippiensis]
MAVESLNNGMTAGVYQVLSTGLRETRDLDRGSRGVVIAAAVSGVLLGCPENIMEDGTPRISQTQVETQTFFYNERDKGAEKDIIRGSVAKRSGGLSQRVTYGQGVGKVGVLQTLTKVRDDSGSTLKGDPLH